MFVTRLNRRRRATVATIAVGTLAVSCMVGLAGSSSASAATDILGPSAVWVRTINDPTKTVWFGSPGVAKLDNDGPSVVIGDTGGTVEAYHVSNGSTVAGWPYKGHVPIFSTPAASTSGGSQRTYIGTGTSAHASVGGYLSLHSNGTVAWYVHHRGDMASMAFGPIQTKTDVVGTVMGDHQYALNAVSGKTLKGFPWFEADTNFSSPALADLNHDGHDEIIEGGDSTHGVAYGYHYTNGGHIRILSSTGRAGHSNPNGGLKCQYNTTQVVQSSPAVGGFLAGGATGIVAGTGTYWAHASDTNKLIAVNTSCKRVWSKTLAGNSVPSPSIADVDGNGTLDVLASSYGGEVYALNGTNGATLWSHKFAHSVEGSMTTFQSPTGKFQYVLAPTTAGLYVLDGRTGEVVQELLPNVSFRNSATVTADPNGTVGVTVAGILSGKSTIQHFEVEGTANVRTVQTYGSWPMFHHDPQLTGYAPYVAPAVVQP
jgi:hypothetical protein